jgi:polysaccharide biosynthesis/export protein
MLSQFLIKPIASLTLLSQSLPIALLPQMVSLSPSRSEFDGGSHQQASLRSTTYLLGAGDRLRIDVFNIPQYSGEYLILTDGTINLQVIGKIFIAGLTLSQAEALIAAQYEPYLQRPLITLNLITPRPLQIAVSGEVKRPGAYTISAQDGSQFPQLTQALQLAGGITQAADIGRVQLVRAATGESFILDLWALTENGNLTQDPVLLDGDSIFIPTATRIDSERTRQLALTSFSPVTGEPVRVVVVGEVQRPGSYTIPIQDGNPFPRLTQALQIAGGTKQAADIGQIQLIRAATGELVTLNLWELTQSGGNLEGDPILLEGDSIFVPTATSIDPERTRQLASTSVAPAASAPIPVVVVGEVFRPGAYTVNTETGTEPPTLTRAIEIAGGITALADVRRIELRRLTQTGLQSLEVNLWELLQSGDVSQDVILQAGDTIAIPTAREIDPTEVAALASASFSPDVIQVNIIGEVQSPGTIQVPPNTPLNQALLAAGGFDPVRAKNNSVILVRLNPDGTVSRQRIAIDFEQGVDPQANPVLRNNDVVVVGRSIVTTIADTAGEILRPVGNFFSFINFFSIFQGGNENN